MTEQRYGLRQQDGRFGIYRLRVNRDGSTSGYRYEYIRWRLPRRVRYALRAVLWPVCWLCWRLAIGTVRQRSTGPPGKVETLTRCLRSRTLAAHANLADDPMTGR